MSHVISAVTDLEWKEQWSKVRKCVKQVFKISVRIHTFEWDFLYGINYKEACESDSAWALYDKY